MKKAAARVAKGVDRAFALTALNPPKLLRRRSSAESLGHAERMTGLASIKWFYNREQFIARPSTMFPSAPPIAPSIRRARGLRGGEVLDLSWDSEFVPLWSREALVQRVAELTPEALAEMGITGHAQTRALFGRLGIDRSGDLAQKYFAARRNRRAHARWFRHASGPRPCAVLLHGYMAGAYAIEERVWPVARLYDSGLDVVITVLPFHAARRAESRGFLPPAFPSNDPRFTVEGFRQLVFDHQALFDYLSAGRVSSLGVMGMSLGGYGAALLSTLDDRLKFAVLFIPLAAIEEFAHAHGRMIGTEAEQRAQRDELGRALWAASPLARASRIDGEHVLVIAGESDVVTGHKHAELLARHFGAPLATFGGGHLLHFGKSRAFEPVFELLDRLFATTGPGARV